MILAVGYRVKSPCGTIVRRWPTERLKEYLVKGFTMDDERLKNPRGTKLNGFLRFNDRSVMAGKGSVSHSDAMRLAEAEYEAFAARRRAMLEAEAERDQQ